MKERFSPQIENLIAAYERVGAPAADETAEVQVTARGCLDVLAALLRMFAGLADVGLDADETDEAMEAAVGGAFAMFCLHINHESASALEDMEGLVDGICAVATEHLESAQPLRSGRLN